MGHAPFSRNEVVLTPLMWRRLIRNGWTRNEFYDEFTSLVEAGDIAIEPIAYTNGWRPTVRGYLYAYTMFDVLKEFGKHDFRLRDGELFWRANLFEDLTEHSLRAVLRDYWGYTDRDVVRVDLSAKEFFGLDYVVMGPTGEWRTGIQCKRFIKTNVPRWRATEEGGYTAGTSAEHVDEEGAKLRDRHRKKHMVLFFWNVWVDPSSRLSRRRWKHLIQGKYSWHDIVFFDKEKWNTRYQLTLDYFSEFVNQELWRSRQKWS